MKPAGWTHEAWAAHLREREAVRTLKRKLYRESVVRVEVLCGRCGRVLVEYREHPEHGVGLGLSSLQQFETAKGMAASDLMQWPRDPHGFELLDCPRDGRLGPVSDTDIADAMTRARESNERVRLRIKRRTR